MIGSLTILPFPFEPTVLSESAPVEPPPPPAAPLPEVYEPYTAPLLNTDDLLCHNEMTLVTIGAIVMTAVVVSVLVTSLLKI